MARNDLDRTSIKIRTDLYKKIVAETGNRETKISIQKYTDEILEKHFSLLAQDKLLDESNLEGLILENFKRVDKHLGSMIARNSMDVSILVVSMMDLIYHIFGKEVEKTALYTEFRVEAAKYFTGQSEVFPRSRDKAD